MKHTPTNKLTIWASANSIESVAGPVSPAEADSLYDFAATEAALAVQRGDEDAARFCATLAVQAARALRPVGRWDAAARAAA